MAQPAPRAAASEDPPVDPEAIDRAYHYHRARRSAKLRRKRESARARLRFVITVTLLVAFGIFLMLTIWHEVQNVFGLKLEQLLGAGEGAQRRRPPRHAAAHRAARELAHDRHAVPALRAVELTLHGLTGSPE